MTTCSCCFSWYSTWQFNIGINPCKDGGSIAGSYMLFLFLGLYDYYCPCHQCLTFAHFILKQQLNVRIRALAYLVNGLELGVITLLKPCKDVGSIAGTYLFSESQICIYHHFPRHRWLPLIQLKQHCNPSCRSIMVWKTNNLVGEILLLRYLLIYKHMIANVYSIHISVYEDIYNQRCWQHFPS